MSPVMAIVRPVLNEPAVPLPVLAKVNVVLAVGSTVAPTTGMLTGVKNPTNSAVRVLVCAFPTYTSRAVVRDPESVESRT